MSKFHIKKDGTPGKCNATKGNCPLGGSDSHFDSAEEAQASAQAKLEEQFGVTGKPSVDLTKAIPIDFVKNYKVDKDYYLKDGEDEDYFFGEVNMELLQLNMEKIDRLLASVPVVSMETGICTSVSVSISTEIFAGPISTISMP